jgi:4-hydroxybenzoate polyprenyltransferase
LWGGAWLAGATHAALIPTAIAFAFVWCRELVKGVEDVVGDAQAGARTLAVTAGRDTAIRVAALSMLIVSIALPVPAVAGVYRAGYAWIMLAAVVPALVVGAMLIARRRDQAACARTSQLLKIAMFAGLAAIVVGT